MMYAVVFRLVVLLLCDVLYRCVVVVYFVDVFVLCSLYCCVVSCCDVMMVYVYRLFCVCKPLRIVYRYM